MTTTGFFSPLIKFTPIYDGLVVEGGFDPDALVQMPTPVSVWPTLTKRARHKLAQRTARLWGSMTLDVGGTTATIPAGLTGDTIEVPEVRK
jgi:hypothetical protein